MKFILLSLISLSVFASADNGVFVEKNTSQISTVSVSSKDSVSVMICEQSGIVFNFSDKNFQRMVVTDTTNFKYQELANNKGFFVNFQNQAGNQRPTSSIILTDELGEDFLVNIQGSNCKNNKGKMASIVNIHFENSVVKM
jgi:hypothetical protein